MNERNLRPWKKGQSGNPTGKSKAQVFIEQAFRDYLEGEVLFKGGKRRKRLEALFTLLDEMTFVRKERWAIEFLLKRVAPESLKLSGHISNPGLSAVVEALASAVDWKAKRDGRG